MGERTRKSSVQKKCIGEDANETRDTSSGSVGIGSTVYSIYKYPLPFTASNAGSSLIERRLKSWGRRCTSLRSGRRNVCSPSIAKSVDFVPQVDHRVWAESSICKNLHRSSLRIDRQPNGIQNNFMQIDKVPNYLLGEVNIAVRGHLKVHRVIQATHYDLLKVTRSEDTIE